MTKNQDQAAADAAANAKAEAEALLEATEIAEKGPLMLASGIAEADGETLWNAEQRRAFVTLHGTGVLIFGAGSSDGSTTIYAVPGAPVLDVTGKQFAYRSDRLVWASKAELVGGAALGFGRRVTHIALADGPDGPVRAVAPLGAPIHWRTNEAYGFAPGAFVFD